MDPQPKLMSRLKGKAVEFGYLFPDDPATIYLDAERKGGHYGYAHEGQLANEGWSEHSADPSAPTDEAS